MPPKQILIINATNTSLVMSSMARWNILDTYDMTIDHEYDTVYYEATRKWVFYCLEIHREKSRDDFLSWLGQNEIQSKCLYCNLLLTWNLIEVSFIVLHPPNLFSIQYSLYNIKITIWQFETFSQPKFRSAINHIHQQHFIFRSAMACQFHSHAFIQTQALTLELFF